MNTTEVMNLLEANQNLEGIQKWKSKNGNSAELKSFGIGLTVLRKLAKQIGKDHHLAVELWNTNIYDAKVISLLVDDPKQITREQAESQVVNVGPGQLEHVFSACGAPLAQSPFVVELTDDWIKSDDPRRRCCGYGLLYELSKSKKKSAPDEAFFKEHVEYINKNFDTEKLSVQESMGGALLGIGKRTAMLNAVALKVARRIGPIEFETEDGNCEPMDIVKHLTSDYIKNKLGV